METQNSTKTTAFKGPEIACYGCAGSIRDALGKMEGVSNVNVDVAEKSVTADHTETVSREAMARALERAGYSTA